MKNWGKKIGGGQVGFRFADVSTPPMYTNRVLVWEDPKVGFQKGALLLRHLARMFQQQLVQVCKKTTWRGEPPLNEKPLGSLR